MEHLERILTHIVDKLESLEQSQREMRQQISMILTTQDQFLKSQLAMEQRIGSLEQRMGSLEQRMDSLEQRMDSLEQRMGSLEQRMDSLEQRMGSLEQRMDSLEQRMDNLERKSEERHMEILERFSLIQRDIDINWDVTNQNKREIERVKKRLDAAM
ncbi:hypothetical protein LSG31_11715 [Fodinisporobacter ferrooxydans]|uniref:Uncharacterized protein n=1 Tax=Fodinisporobacter ferrooxydans TaxID=2901836 RepID=A0ABY4CDM9_9BACL|nr:hypothetical protein LSG31_11715 [Alicyclobacillaceae bacterium MYW30-H2]